MAPKFTPFLALVGCSGLTMRVTLQKFNAKVRTVRLEENERLRLEREQILLDLEKLTSDTSLTLEKLFLKRAERAFWVARRPVCLNSTKTKIYFKP